MFKIYRYAFEGNKTISFSGTYTPTSEGNITVTLDGSATEASDGSTITSFASKTVSVKKAENNNNSNNASNSNSNSNSNTQQQPQAKSNVATLANLGIKGQYDFTGFRAAKTSYSVTVPNEAESVEIYASKGQSGQKITGTGVKQLKEGTNAINVVVTAEDGTTTKTYTINIERKSAETTDNKEENTEETSTDGEAPVYGDNLVWDGNVPVNNGEDVSLLVYAPSGTIGDYYVEWANNYMQLRPNVKIDIQLQTEDVAQKVILETQNGTAPDMFSTHNGWNTAIVNTCGMPWTQDRFNIDGLLKDYVGLEQFKYNDNIYYIPYGIMTSGIFYDKDQ